MARQRRLDLAGLDPEAADLHLLVGAAEEIQHAVAAPAREIAGAVHPAPRRAKRVRHETLRRHSRSPHITPRKSGAANVKLARYPGRDGLQAGVEHIKPRVPDRSSDRDCTRGQISRGDVMNGAADDGLGRPVLVDEACLRGVPVPPCQCIGVERFAADHQAMSDLREPLARNQLPQDIDVCRRQLEQAEWCASGSARQFIELPVLWQQPHRLAGEKRNDKARDGRIECQRGEDRRA